MACMAIIATNSLPSRIATLLRAEKSIDQSYRRSVLVVRADGEGRNGMRAQCTDLT
jgi:hypothetical protein